MKWGIAIMLFCLNIFDDILCVFFTRRMVAGKALQAAILSGILTFVVSISVVNYVENRWYMIPIIIGSMIGTFIAIKLDQEFKRRKNAKKRIRKIVKEHSKDNKTLQKTTEAPKEQKEG